MRIVFQAPDYDFFTRVQGDNKSIDLFIAAMEGLYGRLASSVPESTRLKLIMHNLHSQLQDRLALFDIETLEDLRCLGRKAEAGRLRVRSTTGQKSQFVKSAMYHRTEIAVSGLRSISVICRKKMRLVAYGS
ncbi:hypothetical protein J6590_090319 [Homalodisca vitripennis]|nr:hypothetical protein J6590_090319 [Homalodisca vitripennis]